MSYSKVKLTAEGDVAIVTMADPSTMNALTLEFARELDHAFKAVVSGPNPARAIVLTGEGRGFSGGANVADIGDPDHRPPLGEYLESTYNPLIRTIAGLPVPLVTAVNGPAAGIGCSLAILGDIVVAAEKAFFLQAFSRIGLVPDGGSSYLLTRAIGKARATEMMLMGERLPAPKALEWGLINRCVPEAEVMPTALAIAGDLAKGPASLSLIRKAIWAGFDATFTHQLDHERDAQAIAAQTDDFAEGVAAFLGKRPAAFKGR
jgi:2-(1,2-epoxy-1,2-dihydrophenyl)acetyl-CoA isomerase